MSAALDTSTYEFDKETLREYGLAAIAAIQSDDALNGLTMQNSKNKLEDVSNWLREDPNRLIGYAYFAQSAASKRTHPRHLIDASRFNYSTNIVESEMLLFRSNFLQGTLPAISEEMLCLARRAVDVINKDKQVTSEEEIRNWAKNLAMDFVSKKD